MFSKKGPMNFVSFPFLRLTRFFEEQIKRKSSCDLFIQSCLLKKFGF